MIKCLISCETGNAEEHATLSRALSQLAEVEEKIEQLHINQVQSVTFIISLFVLSLSKVRENLKVN